MISSNSNTLVIDKGLNWLAPKKNDHLIRLGIENDGGYIVDRNSVLKANFLVSMGINDDWSFDEDFLKLRPEIGLHAYDYSISKKIFNRKTLKLFKRLFYGKSKISDVKKNYRIAQNYQTFFQGKVVHFQERVTDAIQSTLDVDMATIFSRITPCEIFIKIDIEGGEYALIDGLVANSDRITGMAIEFHQTSKLRPQFQQAIEKIQEKFELIHLHGNNVGPIAKDGIPDALEISFVNKSIWTSTEHRLELPLEGLDSPNDPLKADYPMIFSV